jgi:cytochrome b6-f complex iron-sulfur subunit
MKLIVLSIAWMCTSAFSPGYINAVHTHNPKTMTAIRAATDDNIYYINEDRRSLMNLILVSSLATTIGGMAIPYFAFFMPPIAIGGTGLTIAKDKVGKDIVVSEYFQDKKLGDRSLVQGLRGDAT